MNKNTITRVAAVAAAVVATAPSSSQAIIPEVSDVTMTQSATRRVTITYRLSDAPAVVTLDIQTNANTSAAADDPGWTSIGGRNICNAQGDVWKKVSGKDTYTITWKPDQVWTDAEGEGFKIAANGARARVTAWPVDNTPNYMVVDISDGAQPNTQKYYHAADFVPGGVTNSIYKTTKLLMRKIMAKNVEWTMGSTTLENQNRQTAREATHQVKLDGNYYIGVYEITQSQWSQVATNSTISANFTTERFMRPMDNVCYNEIRNAANTTTANASYNWPNDPNPSSFLGLLRSKTGIDFDLPSEAQWEFAARAGNGVGYWNDGSAILNATTDANLNLLGRYQYNGGKIGTNSGTDPAANCEAVNGTAIVGSYLPNAWGLYDMHGNVWEWCLDWYEDNINAHGGAVNINPSVPANTLSGVSGANRLKRGGSWNGAAGYCRPAYRNGHSPTSRDNNNGFRVACTAGLQ